MSRKGDCWDNAVVESFFATLKHEPLANRAFASRQAIFAFIEIWYNREQRHSSLEYVSPADYEQRLQTA